MKSFVTGGAGFLGSAVVSRLLARGDDVVALARSDAAATQLTRLGARPVRGDITDAPTLDQLLTDVDLMFHIAGDYRVGIKESEHEAMFRANVDGTTIVLSAAITAAVSKIVYVSTVGVFGNTRGKVVDETYDRPDRDFLSYYDATKYMAHRVAVARAAAGAPLVIAQPGAVYGPGDHSELGAQIDQAARGKYTIRAFPELGFTMSYLDDVADGIVLAQTKGQPGESYVLGGEVTRLGTVVDAVADLTGNKRARIKLPSTVFKAATPSRLAGGTGDGNGPEPARDHPGQQGRHLLGDERQGGAGARVHARAVSTRGCATFSARAEPPHASARAGRRRRLARRCLLAREVGDQRLFLGRRDAGALLDHVLDQRLRLRRAAGMVRGGSAVAGAAARLDERRPVGGAPRCAGVDDWPPPDVPPLFAANELW